MFYSDLIESELSAERERKSALDARGGLLISTSAGLVALVTAVGALVRGNSTDPLSDFATSLLTGALAAFLVAAVCGVVAAWPYGYEAPTVPALEKLRKEHWYDAEEIARARVDDLRITMIRSLRKVNRIKVWFVLSGLGSQLVAVLLAGGMLWELFIDT